MKRITDEAKVARRVVRAYDPGAKIENDRGDFRVVTRCGGWQIGPWTKTASDAWIAAKQVIEREASNGN